MASDKSDKLITVGRLGASYGVMGWIKVHSFTDPIDNILTYQPWLVKRQGQWQPLELTGSRKHNKGIIVAIDGCNNKEDTALYRNLEIAVKREQLPALEAGEFYWTDLHDLKVYTTDGDELGKVDSILATGANDVLVVKGKQEYLIPYLRNEVIKDIDLGNSKIVVDWDVNF